MTEEKTSASNSKPELGLNALVEAILFVSPEPISANQIASLLDVSPREIKNAFVELSQIYESRGIRLQFHKNKVQITFI